MITDKYAIQVMISMYIQHSTLQIYILFFYPLKQGQPSDGEVMGAIQENKHKLAILSVEFYRVYALKN